MGGGDDDEEGGGLLDNVMDLAGGKTGKLFKKGFSKIGKIGGKSFKGISKMAGKIGKFGKGLAKPLTGLFKGGAGKLLGKAGGKFAGKLAGKMALRAGAGALKAIPGLGLAVTAGMAAFDAVDGWKNAASITGKKDKDLTWKDKTAAAGASVLSGLTFGLVDSKTMYKGMNAVGDFAKKAWKYTPLGMASKGISKAWNWLTKPSKKVDKKTGKVIEGKTGLQKIGDVGKASLKKIGSIGKTLFKYTPMGLAVSGISKLFKPKKLKAKAVGLVATKSGMSKYLAKKMEKTKAQKMEREALLAKLSKKTGKASLKAGLNISSKQSKLSTSLKANGKIQGAKEKRTELVQKMKERAKSRQQAADRRINFMPKLITTGIASYFDKHKLKMDLQTGEVNVLPLGQSDIAPKV